MSNNLINCSKISVDCVTNDPVDIKAGGPEYLGFDFFVKEEDANYTMELINNVLNSLQIPVTNIYISEFIKLNPQDIWTCTRIVECINKEADYLKREAKRNYPPINKSK